MKDKSRRFYVIKDNELIAETSTREAAVDLIRSYQEHETHYLLRAEFSIIEGPRQEFIAYPGKNRSAKKERE